MPATITAETCMPVPFTCINVFAIIRWSPYTIMEGFTLGVRYSADTGFTNSLVRTCHTRTNRRYTHGTHKIEPEIIFIYGYLSPTHILAINPAIAIEKLLPLVCYICSRDGDEDIEIEGGEKSGSMRRHRCY